MKASQSAPLLIESNGWRDAGLRPVPLQGNPVYYSLQAKIICNEYFGVRYLRPATTTVA